jgi:hypothetical protein
MARARCTKLGAVSGFGQRGQRGAQRFGLRAEAANPELAALIRHRRRRCLSGAVQGLRQEQARDEKQRNHRQTGAHIRQDELRQQGDTALTGLAQVATHADNAVKSRVDECACVEAVRGKWMFGLALRAVIGAMRIGISQLLVILLHRTGEWV